MKTSACTLGNSEGYFSQFFPQICNLNFFFPWFTNKKKDRLIIIKYKVPPLFDHITKLETDLNLDIDLGVINST